MWTKVRLEPNRVSHSTITALLPLIDQIASGFSKAFDTVNHTALIRSLLYSAMDPTTARCLCSYLHGRTTTCINNGVESGSVVINQGVSRGSVLSPTLFNAYVSDYPHTVGLCSWYADDFTTSASHPDIGEASAIMPNHAVGVETWAGEKEL